MDKKREVDQLFPKALKEDAYQQLVAVSREITDFKTGDAAAAAAALGGAAAAGAAGVDDEHGVAVVFDAESEGSELDEIVEDSEVEDDEGVEAEHTDAVKLVGVRVFSFTVSVAFLLSLFTTLMFQSVLDHLTFVLNPVYYRAKRRADAVTRWTWTCTALMRSGCSERSPPMCAMR